jgi:hypothetical protein
MQVKFWFFYAFCILAILFEKKVDLIFKNEPTFF